MACGDVRSCAWRWGNIPLGVVVVDEVVERGVSRVGFDLVFNLVWGGCGVIALLNIVTLVVILIIMSIMVVLINTCQ